MGMLRLFRCDDWRGRTTDSRRPAAARVAGQRRFQLISLLCVGALALVGCPAPETGPSFTTPVRIAELPPDTLIGFVRSAPSATGGFSSRHVASRSVGNLEVGFDAYDDYGRHGAPNDWTIEENLVGNRLEVRSGSQLISTLEGPLIPPPLPGGGYWIVPRSFSPDKTKVLIERQWFSLGCNCSSVTRTQIYSTANGTTIGPEFSGASPVWKPDSSAVAWGDGMSVRTLAAVGGATPLTIANVGAANICARPDSWSTGDRLVFSCVTHIAPTGLAEYVVWSMSITGADLVELNRFTLPRDYYFLDGPLSALYLPGTNRVIYSSISTVATTFGAIATIALFVRNDEVGSDVRQLTEPSPQLVSGTVYSSVDSVDFVAPG